MWIWGFHLDCDPGESLAGTDALAEPEMHPSERALPESPDEADPPRLDAANRCAKRTRSMNVRSLWVKYTHTHTHTNTHTYTPLNNSF